jgi:1,4-dihydroxy-2-naphthoyl-CoA hydrolase
MNKIWFNNPTLASLNARGLKTMVEHLGIEFIEIGDDFLRAKMPVNEKTKQPIGIMHGGASCVLAETVGSTAANACVNLEKFYCVGLDINTNHIRSVRDGFVFATAIPFHLGRSTQVWEIKILNVQNQMVSINRLTMSVLAR